MLRLLEKAEMELPGLLLSADGWNSLYVDYHAPYVERLWRDREDYRLYLHRIHPCAAEDALFHPHPWPSAMAVVSGKYEMAVGFGPGSVPPPLAATMLLGAGSRYEMTHPDGWHYVRPIGGPSVSLMVTGAPWKRWSPRSEKPLLPLSPSAIDEIIAIFREVYR